MHDPRIGRFLSLDPLFQGYPDLSPYQFAGNSPIACADLDGLERYFAADGTYLGQSKKGGNEIRIATKYNVYAKVDAKGKRENGYIILASKSIRDVSFDTAGKAYATIYNREIRNKATKTPTAIKAVNNTADLNEAAHANIITNEIVMNMAVVQERQHILTDYYNAENVLFHEGKHIEGISDAPLEHFSIWKMQVQDESYAKTTTAHKSYHNLVAKGYLGEMMAQVQEAVSMKGYSSPENRTATIDYYYNVYKTSVEEFNKLTKSHEQILPKEYFENHVENMVKEINRKREESKKKKG